MSHTIQVLGCSLVVCIFVVVMIGGFGLVNQHIEVENFADELSVKVGELGKCEGTEVDKKSSELATAIGFSPDIEITGEYFNGTKRTVQYGNPITITVRYKTKFIGVDGFFIPVVIEKTKTTQSEQYWK